MPTRDREAEVRGTAAEKEITVDRRGNTSIRVSCDASSACPFQEKKWTPWLMNGPTHWRRTEQSESRGTERGK